jgi:hypothetical protein
MKATIKLLEKQRRAGSGDPVLRQSQTQRRAGQGGC